MRISDWSSDVCSSDLHRPRPVRLYGGLWGKACRAQCAERRQPRLRQQRNDVGRVHGSTGSRRGTDRSYGQAAGLCRGNVGKSAEDRVGEGSGSNGRTRWETDDETKKKTTYTKK